MCFTAIRNGTDKEGDIYKLDGYISITDVKAYGDEEMDEN